ncbi:unnamed protein product [Bursaphelenchus okinawaensis]|uniref:U2 snRNP-associated SURP motif-containing protein n=1 Tax=Bursaphelenchus okinawaensis TaxID=465554 RepID=A0A811LIQ5_9BILA|nr:unnamed protein product [Bursaphelenchus okinawaensis]CAG9126737.1 unnamed protein product [Bursaphelenchus okinawaensis]
MERLKRRNDTDEKERLSQVFEEFKEDFDGTKLKIGNAFVRGEIVNAGKTVVTKPVDPEKAKEIASKIGQRIILEAKQKKVASQIQLGGGNVVEDGAKRPPKPGTKKETSTRKSNLEAFKEELKQIQELRQERRQQLKSKFGDSAAAERLVQESFSIGHSEFDTDPNTTNLYLASLDPDITLDDLYDTFGSFGPLASAKILYPKPEEMRKCPLLSGFVAFMSRTDAERAMEVMPGAKIRTSCIRASWAKPIIVPSVPFFIPQCLRDFSMPDPPSGLPFNAKPDKYDLRRFLKKYEKVPRLTELAEMSEEMRKAYDKMVRNAVVRVVTPTEKPLLFLIHRVIEFLIREGPMFEALIMKRERTNPMYRFLFDNTHPTHVYYRWRQYSVLNGEDRFNWSLKRFKMFEGGSWWEPPPHSLLGAGMPPQLYKKAYKSREVEERRRQKSKSPETPAKDKRDSPETKEDAEPEKVRGVLSEKEWDELQDLLRDLKPERTAIGDAMLWCVDHADCAKEISECLYQSLTIKETPLHKKIARLYLIADILANCGIRVTDVFKYRHCFEEHLTAIFTSLNETLEGIESRLKAEQFRQRVMLCFRNWEDNSIYPRDVLINLQNIFLGLVKVGQPKSHSDDEDDVDGIPLNSVMPSTSETDNKAESEEEDDDIDGVPLQAEPIEDKTQEPDKVNVIEEVMDDVSSKWDVIEHDTVVEEAKNEPKGFFKPLKEVSEPLEQPKRTESQEYSDSLNKSSAWEEERRRLLRDIEMKVVEYQDELESDLASNVDQRLSDYRQKLIQKMDRDLATFEEGELMRDKKSEKKKEEQEIKEQIEQQNKVKTLKVEKSAEITKRRKDSPSRHRRNRSSERERRRR